MPRPRRDRAIGVVVRPRRPGRVYRDDVARAGFVVSGVAAAVVGGALLAGGIVVGDGVRLRTARCPPTPTRVDGVGRRAPRRRPPDRRGRAARARRRRRRSPSPPRSADGSPVFLGAAAGADLDTYLAGCAVRRGRRADHPGQRPRPGRCPGPSSPRRRPPSSSGCVRTRGHPRELTARIPDGATVVLMRADATPGVAADLAVTLEVDRAWPAALVTGGARRRAARPSRWAAARRRRAAATPPPPPVPPLGARGRHGAAGRGGSGGPLGRLGSRHGRAGDRGPDRPDPHRAQRPELPAAARACRSSCG